MASIVYTKDVILLFYTEARGVRDIRDITGMPASDWQNTPEIHRE